MGDKFLLKAFLFTYLVSTAFTDVLTLPGIVSKIQVPELVFFPLFAIWLFELFKERKFSNSRIEPLEWAILLYIFFTMISALISGEQSSWLEVTGLIYLAAVYLVYKTSLRFIPRSGNFVYSAFIVCGVIASLTGIAGWVLSTTGFETVLAMPADHPYPYMGPVSRATGWMVSPNMLFNLISVVLLIYFPLFTEKWKKSAWHILLLVVLLAGSILTFSKSLLLLIIGILLILLAGLDVRKKHRDLVVIFCTFLLLLFLGGTHILARKASLEDRTIKREKAYTAAHPFLEWNGLEFYLTNYTINKSAALRAGIENPLHGVGPGQFNDYVGKLKEEGNYPAHFINFDPHSTYLGAFAEGGFPLLTALLFLVWQIIKMIRKQKHIGAEKKPLTTGVIIALLFMGMEAISMDILNFRHLWILIAVLASLPFLHLSNNQINLFADQPHHIKTVGKNQ